MDELNDDFLKRYKKWLLKFNRLTDCSYRAETGRRRLRQSELNAFRNQPTLQFVEREVDGYRFPQRIFRTSYSPTYDQLAQHLVSHQDATIYMVNSGGHDVLLMLADLDNKDGRGEIDKASAYFNQQFLGSRGFVEESTFGLGRHIYFKLALDYAPLRVVREAMKLFAEDFVLKDQRFEDWGIKLDGCLPLPLPQLSDSMFSEAAPPVSPATASVKRLIAVGSWMFALGFVHG